MKKTYFAPSVKVTEINAEELICVSLMNDKATNSTVLSRERGTRQSDEVLEELW